jgi:hypothetical protein
LDAEADSNGERRRERENHSQSPDPPGLRVIRADVFYFRQRRPKLGPHLAGTVERARMRGACVTPYAKGFVILRRRVSRRQAHNPGHRLFIDIGGVFPAVNWMQHTC